MEEPVAALAGGVRGGVGVVSSGQLRDRGGTDRPDADNAIITVGRNRVMQAQRAPRTLSGNMMADDEMDVFADLDRFNAQGLHLYTTLQPVPDVCCRQPCS